MKIREFVEKMSAENMTVSDLIAVRKYISAAEKLRIAKEVADFSFEYDRGFIKFDNYRKHLAFIFSVIEAHTDLHFANDWANKMQEYDILCENELLDAVVDTFRKDYEASLGVLDIICSDMLVDNSIEASLAKLMTSISENLDEFVGMLADKLKKIDIEKIIPKDLDLNKLQRLLNKIK